MRVYRWRKPKLNIELVEGGTLQENITYYIFAGIGTSSFSTNKDWYVNSAPVTDTYSITTDSINKSIKVSFYFDGEINGIVDNGDETITINSPMHCLDTGDIITISDTFSYNGDYTITERVDYNNFKINKPFLGNETGSWAANGYVNNLNRWYLYCSTIDPRDADGSFKNTTEVKNKYYPNNGNTLSGTEYTITAEIGSTRYSPGTTWELYPYTSYKFYLETGYPTLYGTETSVSINDIRNELDAGGLGDYNFYPHYISCNILLPNASLTLSNYSINLIATDHRCPNFIYDRCSIGGHSPFVYNYRGSNEGFYGILRDSSFLSSRRNFTIFEGVNRIFVPFNGTTDKQNVIASSITYGWERVTSPTTVFKNFTYLGTYPWIMYHVNTYAGYSVENLDLKSTHLSSYDMVLSNQTNTLPLYKLLNIDTGRVNNEKKINMQGAYHPSNVEFYRSRNIRVTDEDGNAIENVLIKITGDNNQEYEVLTNEEGISYFEVIEQLAYSVEGSSSRLNTIYFNWVLEASKNGYETYKATFNIAKDIEEEITLAPKKGVKMIKIGNKFIGT